MLQKNEALIAQIQSIAHIGNWEWNIENDNIYWSDELYRIYGLEPQSIKISFNEFISRIYPDDREKIKTIIESVLKEFKTVNFEERIVRPDGSLRYLQSKAEIILEEDKPKYLVGICHDITEKVENSIIKDYSKKLEESEERFRNLALSTSQIIWTTNPQGEVTEDSESWREFTGQSLEEYLGTNFMSAIHPDDREKTFAVWQNSVNNKTLYETEYRLRKKDCSYANMQVKAIPVFEDDEIKEWFGANTDITEKKAIEEQIRKNEENFKFLAETIPQLVWTTNADGQTDYLNHRWNEYIGITPFTEEAETAMIIHHDDIENAQELWKEALISSRPYQVEYRIRRSDGMYRWHIARAVPLKNEEGTIIKWFGTATDIDEQKRTEDVQKFLSKASHQLISSINYHETLKNIAEMAVPFFADWCRVDIYDKENNKIELLAVAHENPEKIKYALELEKRFPPDPNAPSGTGNVIKTCKPEFYSVIPDELIDAIEDKELVSIIKEIGLKSSICVPLIVNGEGIGAITFINAESRRAYTNEDLSIAEDLARRSSLAMANANLYLKLEKQSEQLKNANQELERFAYVASHDLSEPLRTISGYAQLLERRYKDALDNDATEFINLIVSGAKRMRNLIDDLLEYSKAGFSQIDSKEIDLNKVMDIILINLDSVIKENEAVINCQKLPLMKGDITLIIQLFQNLIANSIKYRRDEKPVININYYDKDNEHFFTVEDNGIGIKEEFFDKIFVIFQRLHGKEQYSGTGIGLATCKKIVNAYGGKIWLESKEGKGSNFSFTLKK